MPYLFNFFLRDSSICIFINPAFQIQINISHLKGDIYLLRIQINQNNELHVKECFEPSNKVLVRNMIPEFLLLDLVNGTPLNTSLPSKSIKKLFCKSLRLLVQPYNQIKSSDMQTQNSETSLYLHSYQSFEARWVGFGT